MIGRMGAELTSLLRDLVAIDSVNPALVPGGAGEAAIAHFVAGWAAERLLEVTTIEGTPGRPSVLVRARGTGGGRTLLLCGHLDTVTVEHMADPHVPRIDGDRLYGRGAYDMKAPRSSPSRPSSRWPSPTRASCGASWRSPAVPPTGPDRSSASTRSPRRGPC